MPMDAEQQTPLSASLEALLSAIGEAAYEWRLASDELRWTAGAERILGIDAASIATGRAYGDLTDPESLTSRATAVTGAARTDAGDGVPYAITSMLRVPSRGGARTMWVEDVGRWWAGADGRPAVARGVVRIVTDRLEAEQRRAWTSRTDPLTGALDRARIEEVLAASVAEAKKMLGSCGLVQVSVEGLGTINDAYGVRVADEVIAGVARRIRGRMRVGDQLGRYSTTSFFVVLANCSATDLEIAMRRFLEAVREEPLATTAGAIAPRVALGGAVAPRHARTPVDLVLKTREAMLKARDRRSAGMAVYAPDPVREERRRTDLELTQTLIEALNARRVSIAFQPVVRTADRACMWHEALARVETEAGLESISRYIMPAERLGIIPILDRRVLELAFARLDRDKAARIAVNVSAATVTDPEWRTLLAGLAALVPGAAERLVVEITETAALDDLDDAAAFVREMQAAGVRIAIDDFGAGHTSFRVLRRLGVDLVKIDGAYAARVVDSAEDRAFVRAIVGLARDVGFQTVAECVETEDVAEALAALGVDFLQGDHLGAPAPEMVGGEVAGVLSGLARLGAA